jgi:hypothetical protein
MWCGEGQTTPLLNDECKQVVSEGTKLQLNIKFILYGLYDGNIQIKIHNFNIFCVNVNICIYICRTFILNSPTETSLPVGTLLTVGNTDT